MLAILDWVDTKEKKKLAMWVSVGKKDDGSLIRE